jgi:hypothetical protein
LEWKTAALKPPFFLVGLAGGAGVFGRIPDFGWSKGFSEGRNYI